MTASYTASTDLLESTTLGAVETTYSYSGFGDLTGIVYEASNVPFHDVAYTRDAFGRVATKTETRPSGSTLRCYVYDGSDRLEAVYDGADSSRPSSAGVSDCASARRCSWSCSDNSALRELWHTNVNRQRPSEQPFRQRVGIAADYLGPVFEGEEFLGGLPRPPRLVGEVRLGGPRR